MNDHHINMPPFGSPMEMLDGICHAAMEADELNAKAIIAEVSQLTLNVKKTGLKKATKADNRLKFFGYAGHLVAKGPWIIEAAIEAGLIYQPNFWAAIGAMRGNMIRPTPEDNRLGFQQWMRSMMMVNERFSNLGRFVEPTNLTESARKQTEARATEMSAAATRQLDLAHDSELYVETRKINDLVVVRPGVCAFIVERGDVIPETLLPHDMIFFSDRLPTKELRQYYLDSMDVCVPGGRSYLARVSNRLTGIELSFVQNGEVRPITAQTEVVASSIRSGHTDSESFLYMEPGCVRSIAMELTLYNSIRGYRNREIRMQDPEAYENRRLVTNLNQQCGGMLNRWADRMADQMTRPSGTGLSSKQYRRTVNQGIGDIHSTASMKTTEMILAPRMVWIRNARPYATMMPYGSKDNMRWESGLRGIEETTLLLMSPLSLCSNTSRALYGRLGPWYLGSPGSMPLRAFTEFVRRDMAGTTYRMQAAWDDQKYWRGRPEQVMNPIFANFKRT